MKQLLFLLSSIGIMLMSTSCDKDDSTPFIPIYVPGDTTFGSALGTKEGHDWSAAGHGIRHNDGSLFWSISLGTESIEGFLRESLRLGHIPPRTGTYTISNTHDVSVITARYNTVADDGDVLEDVYHVDETVASNIAEITKIDTTANIIEGVFTVTFDMVDPANKRNPINPDRVTFADVSFSVQIIQ